MQVKIFTECGSEIGMGHMTRCLSLYAEIARRGIYVELIVYSDLPGLNFSDDVNISFLDWMNEKYISESINKDYRCIVDSYLAGKEIYEVISRNSYKALFIDDTIRIDYPAGIVANPSIGAEKLNYPTRSDITYLLGSKYIILRDSFLNLTKKRVNKAVEKVLITMGGSDIRNLTPLIAKEICSAYPYIHFNVVLGNANNNANIITPSENISVYNNVDAELMKDLMLESDAAITAAGQTIYELMASKTPFLAITVADNQENNFNALKSIFPKQLRLTYNEEFFIESLHEKFKLILDYELRKEISKCYFNIVDGLGKTLLINVLLG
jgi:spore coat polysaccharide biosynthesis predicted glycosyltransferase SpsG